MARNRLDLVAIDIVEKPGSDASEQQQDQQHQRNQADDAADDGNLQQDEHDCDDDQQSHKSASHSSPLSFEDQIGQSSARNLGPQSQRKDRAQTLGDGGPSSGRRDRRSPGVRLDRLVPIYRF